MVREHGVPRMRGARIDGAGYTGHDPPAHLLPRPHGGAPDAHAVLLGDVLDELPAGDPELTFVIVVCAYAGDVLSGPGPYTDEDARRSARAGLVGIRTRPYDECGFSAGGNAA
jgi:hypothetical protein